MKWVVPHLLYYYELYELCPESVCCIIKHKKRKKVWQPSPLTNHIKVRKNKIASAGWI